ncbi:hypothetical protein [Anaerotruncus sp. 80]|nr:hypothetical protein [Anaerotruncus sp. 80]
MTGLASASLFLLETGFVAAWPATAPAVTYVQRARRTAPDPVP